jgi:hypothetical protein
MLSWMIAEVVDNLKGGRGPMAVAVFKVFDDCPFEGWVLILMSFLLLISKRWGIPHLMLFHLS